MAGEIGLSGEIRPVTRIAQRVSEGERLGFQRILIPEMSMKSLQPEHLRIELVPVAKVEDALRYLFQ